MESDAAMIKSTMVKNWKVETDDQNIAWLAIDNSESDVNVLSKETIFELEEILAKIKIPAPRGLIIYSAKKSGFIAGADVHEFDKIDNEQEALSLIKRGQSVMDEIEKLPFPTVAMIDGFCLGGGMELALACDYRVATDSPSTKLGLPEVLLGIHPGFGGSVRSTRLIGGKDAMEMMLTGRAMNSKIAKKKGLVDHAVPHRHLKRAAIAMVMKGKPDRKGSLVGRTSNQRLARQQLSKIMRKNVEKKAPSKHYPSPYALIELWRDHFDDKDVMMRKEAESVAKLIIGETAQNLVRLFFLQEKMKATGKESTFSVKKVHVIGAGVMGGDIASWLALRGYNITLQDTEAARISPAIKRAASLFKKKLKEPRLIAAAMDRLTPDIDGFGIETADVVIEAIFENADVKKELYANVEPRMKEGAILATNTSSIPLEKLSDGVKNRDRFVGIHFFNPVSMMKLVEVVKGAETSETTVNDASSFVKGMDRLPLVVKSSLGFLVNRILMPYLTEAILLADEGVPVSLIDKAATDFGMPMGPITLADSVGLDICLSVAKILGEATGQDVPKTFEDMVNNGNLGKKSGEGFYKYKDGKKVKPKVDEAITAPDDLADRLILRMVNEAVACKREGIVNEDEMIDAGVVFGTGFAPFRGGPMNYIKAVGASLVLERLRKLESTHGDRFKEDAGWKIEPTGD